MKSVILVLSVLFSMNAFANDSLQCADKAVEAATLKNYLRFGAETGSCGAKLLTAGDYSETYLVCVSDESDPSEWVVVIKKHEVTKKGQITASCVVKYADTQYDSQVPHFEDGTDLLVTKECLSHEDSSGHRSVICK